MKKNPPFLMWYDDNPKLSINHKISAAIEAYTERFQGAQPNLVLVNDQDVTTVEGIQIRGVGHVRRNNFWVGREEFQEARPA
jgi:hypothetical protein